MPTLTQTPVVTATETHTVQLSPAIRRRLLNEFRQYQQLKEKLDALKTQMDTIKGKIGAIREETGEQSIELEGYHVTLVASFRKKFDPKKFVLLGGDLDLYNKANIDTPIKPFEKLTMPGQSKDEY